jgi:hypothetical protein
VSLSLKKEDSFFQGIHPSHFWVRKKKSWDLFLLLLLIMMIVDDDYCFGFGAAGFSQVVAI